MTEATTCRRRLPIAVHTTGRKLAAVAVASAVLCLMWVANPPPADAQAGGNVVINEFVARNSDGLIDAYGEQSDWLELHNTTGSTVAIAGWTLVAGVDSWTIPADTSIPANGYLLVHASGRNTVAPDGELHAGLKLDAGGEYLALFNGATVVSEYAPAYPSQVRDQSYGLDGSGQLAYFLSPTPGATNGTPMAGPIEFGTDHGFFTNAFSLSLGSARPGVNIRYTTNGDEPTTGSGQIYNGPFTINQTTVVRAIAYGNGNDTSFIATRTFLFLNDVIDQDSTPPNMPSGSVNNQILDWGMDPNVVNGNRAAVRSSLEAIPTLSLVTDPDNLFDANNGIYVNPYEDGRDWERPASIELIDPAGGDDFAVNAGVRIRGGASRNPANPKHAFRLFFRSEYGDAKLDFPLFGNDGTDSFDKVDLRTSQNYSWARGGNADNTLLRELWSRDTQSAMGQPHTRSNHYHLYLNGQYFGIFQTQERVSEEYAESYFGGDADDYDVVKHDRDLGYRVRATSGSDADWKSLFSLVSDQIVSNSEFNTIASQVDLENLADYFLLHYFSGDADGAPSDFLGGYERANNWYAVRDRNGGQWRFFDHDSEHSLCVGGRSPANVDNSHGVWRLGPAANSNWNADYMNPGWLHAGLLSNDNYVQIFRDSVQEHFVDANGALQVAASQDRVDQRASSFADAVLAHSARWGDRAIEPPRGVSDWEDAVDDVRDCFSQRRSALTSQLQGYNLMPEVDPPFITTAPGAVSHGQTVSIANPNGSGTIWYTTDGSDPLGTNLQPSATASSGSTASITDYSNVTARVLQNGDWSSPVSALFSLSSLPLDPIVVLNEYNGVAGNELLGNNASDVHFGRVPGNGGDWFELIVVEDGADLRGWQLELIDGSRNPPETRDLFVLGSQSALSNIAAGTIITVSEDVADDVSVDQQSGDWWMNLQANDGDAGSYITAASQQNFDTNHENWQLIIRDASGAVRALRTGEGEGPLAGVSASEVGKLEATPTSQTRPDSNYDDGTTSTFGQPNAWDAVIQDLSVYRNAPPAVSAVADQFDNEGTSVNLSLSATDEGTVSWSASGLPDGLTINSTTGVISGTITGPQNSSVTVTAEDTAQLADSVTFNWEVNRRPALPAIMDQTTPAGFAASLSIPATDPDADALVYTVSGLPSGLTFLNDINRVSGFAQTPGSYNVQVTVTDEHDLAASRSFTWNVDGGTPSASLGSRCVSGNGVLDIQLVNPEFFAVDFTVSATGLPDRTVSVAADATRQTWFSGRPDGSYDVTVEAQGVELVSDELTIACDDPVTITSTCLAGRGRVDVNLINQSAGTGSFVVEIGALVRNLTVDPWSTGRVAVTGRPEGFLDVTVTRNATVLLTEQLLIDCTQSPESEISSRCFAGAGRVDARIVNDTQAAGDYEFRVTGLPSRLATVNAQESVLLSRTGRVDGFYDVAVFRDGAKIDEDRVLINCVSGPEVAAAVTCLNSDGRVDVALNNDTRVDRSYTVVIGGLSPQAIDLAAQESGTATRTGRPDGDLTITVDRDGQEISSEVLTVACDAPVEPVTVAVSCLAGFGRVDADLFNDTATTADFEVFFGPFPAKSQLLAPGDAARKSITGRPDGPFDVTVERDGTVVVATTVMIACN